LSQDFTSGYSKVSAFGAANKSCRASAVMHTVDYVWQRIIRGRCAIHRETELVKGTAR